MVGSYSGRVHDVLPAILALGAAVLAAIGTVLRQRATIAPGGLGASWFLGAGLALAGFALQATALVLGSVLLVQPLVVLSVLFALPIQTWLTKIPATSREWLLGGAVALGVAVFIVFAHPVHDRHGRDRWVLQLVIGGLLVAVVAMVGIARQRTPDGANGANVAGVLYGTAAGTLFGLLAVQVKDVSADLDHPSRMFANPTLYLFVLTAAAGVWCQQKSFAAGALSASYPAMVVSEPVVAMTVSLAVLGEKLTARSLSTAISLVGLALMIFAVLRLARTSATRAAVEE